MTGRSFDGGLPTPRETAGMGSLEDRLLRARVAPPPLFSLDGAAPPVADAARARRPRPSPAASPDPTRVAPAALHALLTTAARARLGQSADRVERLLSQAAAQGLPVSAVPAQVRGLSVRGVTAQTLGLLADDLERILQSYPAPGPAEVRPGR